MTRFQVPTYNPNPRMFAVVVLALICNVDVRASCSPQSGARVVGGEPRCNIAQSVNLLLLSRCTNAVQHGHAWSLSKRANIRPKTSSKMDHSTNQTQPNLNQ